MRSLTEYSRSREGVDRRDTRKYASAAEQFGEQITIDHGSHRAGYHPCLSTRSRPRRSAASLLEELRTKPAGGSAITIPRQPAIDRYPRGAGAGPPGDIDGAIELAADCARQLPPLGRVHVAGGGDSGLGGVAAAPRFRCRPAGSAGCDRESWRPCRPNPASSCTRSGCCDFGRCWRRQKATTPTYRDYRDRYRQMANDLGFEGHMQWAAEMV